MAITKATASSVAPAAKGDLVVGSGTNDAAVLAVGTNDYVLTAASGETTGLKWAAPAGGGLNSYTLLNSGGTSLTGAATITVSGISNQQALIIRVAVGSSANAGSIFGVRFNADTANNYYGVGQIFNPTGPTVASTEYGESYARVGTGSSNHLSELYFTMLVFGTSESGYMSYINTGGAALNGGTNPSQFVLAGHYNASAAITSVSLVSSSGNFDGGTLFVYGMAA